MPNWKKVIVSGSNADLANLSAESYNVVITGSGSVPEKPYSIPFVTSASDSSSLFVDNQAKLLWYPVGTLEVGGNVEATGFVTASNVNVSTNVIVGGNVTGSKVQIDGLSSGTTENRIVVADTGGNLKFRTDLSLTGAQGATGATGAAGNKGSQGDKGATGPTGPQGNKGQKGEVGAQGDQGAQGTTGTQGNKGQKGEVGAQGDKGQKGATGGQGGQGAQGPTGPTGPGVSTSSNTQINSLGVGVSASGTTGSIRATNDIVAYYSSDIRLKDNRRPIINALEKVTKLTGIHFDWIANQEIHDNEGSDIGVIAQEVEEIFPEIVETRTNGYKAVRYDRLIAVIIQAIKELKELIDKK